LATRFTGDVADDEQPLLAGRRRDEPERQPAILRHRQMHARCRTGSAPLHVLDEFRMTHQVVDPEPVIGLALEIEPARRGAVEPEYLVAGAEKNRTVRHR
jgi:hypothetical protein